VEIGINLPNAVPDVNRRAIIDWATGAEQLGFSSVAVLDRITYLNYESMVTLAAVASMTERVRLFSNVILAPLRSNVALLAKQAATVDQLSEGRLTLGLGLGRKSEDDAISGLDFAGRGRGDVFDRQLVELNELWSGARTGADSGEALGPRPVSGRRPLLLIGGSHPKAFRRAAQHADGWTSGTSGSADFEAGLSQLLEAWQEAGREDRPRTSASLYFALSPTAQGDMAETLGRFYGFGGYTQTRIEDTVTDADSLKRILDRFEQAGVDEVICVPVSSYVGEIELLAKGAGL